MSLKSPVSTMFNSDGYEIAVKDGIALPANPAGILLSGSDGTDTHYISLDEEGRKLVVGAGTAGSPAGGVISAQGTAGESDEVKIMGHVDIDNFPTDLSIVQDNAAELLASVGGLGAAGSAVVGNPVRLGAPEASTYGSIDNFTNNIRTDSSGRLEAAGPSDLGEAVSGAPVRIGASDGSLTTDVASDSEGRLVRVGAADAGSAVSAAPVRLGGSDGSLTTDLLTDSEGRIIGAGAASDGSALAGYPARLGASDGTNTQDILSDSAGRLISVGAAAAGSAPSGNPLLSAGWDGTNVQIFKLDSLGAVQVNEVKSDTATIYDTAATTSSATLLSSNAAREGAIVYNDSNRFLYVRLGHGASSSSFTTRIAPYGQYLVPAGFTGEISGIWADVSAVGTARVTEFAPGGGGGGGGGASRPLVDGNHIHVWNFNEAGGATQIIDSVGGKNLTLHGTEGTDYALYQSKTGVANPWFEIKGDGSNLVIADNSTMNISGLTAITLECVMYLDALPSGGSDWRSIIDLSGTPSGSLNEVYLSMYQSYIYGGVHKGGQNSYSSPSNYPPVSQPFHVMFVYDKDVTEGGYCLTKTYVNGISQGNVVGGYAFTMEGMTQLNIGGKPGESVTPKGFIRDVRISNIGRSAAYGVSAAAALTT